MYIRIIVASDQSGLGQDARIIEKLVLKKYKKCKIVYAKSASKEESKEMALINIYLEHLDLGLFSMHLGKFPAHHRWFIPNQEFFEYNDYELTCYIDAILCKTKSMYTELNSIINTAHYTQFTSETNCKITKGDRNFYMHIGSMHMFKNSVLVLETWLKYFADNPKLTLLITKNKVVFSDEHETMLKILKSFKYKKETTFKGLKIDTICYKNIYFPTSYIDKDVFNKLIEQVGVFIQPSIAEGFGHTINEGRACKKLVITTNGSPMNELITDESGILVNYKTKQKTYLYFPKVENATEQNDYNHMWSHFENIYGYNIDQADLAKAITKSLELSDDEFDKKINLAYGGYINQKEHFEDKFLKLLDEYLAKGKKQKISFDRIELNVIHNNKYLDIFNKSYIYIII
jgi:hypothetical protein